MTKPTITGRLDQSGPNMQNIPIRTKEGAAIRAAIMAGEMSVAPVPPDMFIVDSPGLYCQKFGRAYRPGKDGPK